MRAGSTTTVVVLSSREDHPWPGLDELAQMPAVRLRQVCDEADLAEVIGEADVLVVTDFRSRALRRLWPQTGRLRWVHATSAGVDALLFPELVEADVPVTHAPGVFDEAIGEYVCALMLAFAKDLPGTLALQREGRWLHRDTERLAGRRLLVVGAGRVGSAIACRARLLGMDTAGIARRARPGDDAFGAVRPIGDLERELGLADYVVIAAPLTSETRGLFDRRALAAMRPAARLINVGRGAIVVTDDLVAALEQREIAGAALDTVEGEPLGSDHRLWRMPGVVISPHMAGDVRGWREDLSRQFIRLFRAWRNGRPLEHVVDKRRGYGPATT